MEFQSTREATMLSYCSHPFIVRLIESFTSHDVTVLVMDRYQYDLQGLISSCDNGLSVGYLLPLFRRLVTAVAFIHAQGIAHCDIWPAQVLVRGKAPRASCI